MPSSDRFESLPTIPDPGSRPIVARWYLGAWLVLFAALPLGLEAYYSSGWIGISTWMIGETGTGNYMGINYHVYHVAAEHAVAGEPFYDVSPETASDFYVYLYPPVTVLAFYPFTLFDWTTGYNILMGLSVVGSALATFCIVQYVEEKGHPLGWVDVALIFSLFVLSTHVYATVFFGNINILLGVGFAVGFWALARDRNVVAGFAFAATALFKVFPALVGLWLLRDRQWTATAAALATGIGGLLVGAVLFGVDTSIYYFTDVLTGRGGSDAFVGGYPASGLYYVTIQRPLSHILYAGPLHPPYMALPIAAMVVCGAVLAYFYRNVRGQTERLMAILATVIVTLVLFPSFRMYVTLLFLPLVALLYVWDDAGPGWFVFIAGGILISITEGPEDVVNFSEAHLGSLSDVGVTLGTFASLQLYGFALMLLGCAYYIYRTSDGENREDDTVETVTSPET